jgi:hypothetical protein
VDGAGHARDGHGSRPLAALVDVETVNGARWFAVDRHTERCCAPWSVTAPRRDARHAQYRICPRDLIHGRLRWSVTEDPSAFALPPSRFALRRTRRDTTLMSQGRKSFTAQFRRLSRAAARKRPRQPAIIRPQENSASEYVANL